MLDNFSNLHHLPQAIELGKLRETYEAQIRGLYSYTMAIVQEVGGIVVELCTLFRRWQSCLPGEKIESRLLSTGLVWALAAMMQWPEKSSRYFSLHARCFGLDVSIAELVINHTT